MANFMIFWTYTKSMGILLRIINICLMEILLIVGPFLLNVCLLWLHGNVRIKSFCIWLEEIIRLNKLTWYMDLKDKSKLSTKMLEYMKHSLNYFVVFLLVMFLMIKLWYVMEVSPAMMESLLKTLKKLTDLSSLQSVA